MGRVKHCCWLILTILLLTGCSNSLNLYTVVGIVDDTYIVTDGELLYEYKEELTILRKEFKEVNPVRPLSAYGKEYSLKHLELNKYEGDMKDAVAYYNYLLDENFTTDRLEYYFNYLDVKVSNDMGEEIRVIYLGSDIVRVFYKTPSNKNLLPPYIHREE